MDERSVPEGPEEIESRLPGGGKPAVSAEEAGTENNRPLATDGVHGAETEASGRADDPANMPGNDGSSAGEGTDDKPSRPQRPLDPPKLVRLANLAREVLEEVRQMTPQDSTVRDLASLYRRVEDQLKDALPEPLAEELDAMELDFSFKDGANQEEVRIALSGLTGWLGGLFQGLHASILAATPVLELPPEVRPPGAMPPGQAPGQRPGLQPGRVSPEERKGEGYL